MKVPINLLTAEGVFYEPPIEAKNLDEIENSVKKGAEHLFKIPVGSILDILHSFSRLIIRDPVVKQIEGIAFLSNWLRRENLKRLLEINIGSNDRMESFFGEGRKRIRAFPRGVVCHWIAGKIPTLALFSLFQSTIAKNANILRVPEVSLDTVLPILSLLEECKVDGY